MNVQYRHPAARKRRRPIRIEVVQNGKTLSTEQAKVLLERVNQKLASNQDRSRLQSRLDRVKGPPDRSGMARAMILVEARLVKAFWTIAQQASGSILRPSASSRHGVDYLHDPDRDDHARYADSPSGDWKSAMPVPPRPLPSSREIDAAAEAQEWLLFVPEDDRKLLILAATSKRGDAGRNVNWKRIIESRKELDMPIRSLQARYQNALRTIVLMLALAHVA